MDIIVKGRHTGVSDRFREYVTTKLIKKIERFDQKVQRVDVEVSKERNPRQADQSERVELTIHTRGPIIRGEASSDDRFAAFDVAWTKLLGRLRKINDRRKVHRGRHAPPSVAEVAAMEEQDAERRNGRAATQTVVEERDQSDAALESPDQHDEQVVPIAMQGDGPLVVREKAHRATPVTIEQALLEMELVGHDFYLFRDKESGQPSVVYRRRGYDYGVIRLEEGP